MLLSLSGSPSLCQAGNEKSIFTAWKNKPDTLCVTPQHMYERLVKVSRLICTSKMTCLFKAPQYTSQVASLRERERQDVDFMRPN